MEQVRSVIVFDAADIKAESAFWAAVFNGKVLLEDTWASIVDEKGEWRLAVQLSPNHIRPEWPSGAQQQQIHLDLHAVDRDKAHQEVIALGATLLQPSDNPDAEEGFQVYASPAGHPFCIGWGHPTADQLATFLKDHFGSSAS